MNIIPSTIPDGSVDPALVAIDSKYASIPVSASGAIIITDGKIGITAVGVAALTLAVPVAGLPSAGGNDGQELTFTDEGGHAHTITTPASGINGSTHICTMGGTKGQKVTFTARAGVWWVNPSGSGYALT